jgi:hypothetical protein
MRTAVKTVSLHFRATRLSSTAPKLSPTSIPCGRWPILEYAVMLASYSMGCVSLWLHYAVPSMHTWLLSLAILAGGTLFALRYFLTSFGVGGSKEIVLQGNKTSEIQWKIVSSQVRGPIETFHKYLHACLLLRVPVIAYHTTDGFLSFQMSGTIDSSANSSC